MSFEFLFTLTPNLKTYFFDLSFCENKISLKILKIVTGLLKCLWDKCWFVLRESIKCDYEDPFLTKNIKKTSSTREQLY